MGDSWSKPITLLKGVSGVAIRRTLYSQAGVLKQRTRVAVSMKGLFQAFLVSFRSSVQFLQNFYHNDYY